MEKEKYILSRTNAMCVLCIHSFKNIYVENLQKIIMEAIHCIKNSETKRIIFNYG